MNRSIRDRRDEKLAARIVHRPPLVYADEPSLIFEAELSGAWYPDEQG